ncbi:MAG: ABC transporter substrate-binding protein [Eubacterium sp.]|nr:ABC transporter substrate-binding protein [Eubacterium sp.]
MRQVRKHRTGSSKKMVKALALAAAMCVAGGTAAASGAVEVGAAELQPVTILLDWTPNTNHTGIYVAKELGYYEQAGLDVNIEVPYAETATQLVATGKGDFGISNTEDTLSAISLKDPMPVKSVAAIIQHNTSGFVSLKEEGIESPADWAGKTYGGYGGTLEEKVVRKIAADNGVDPDSIRFVDLGDTDTLTSLQNDIDFIWVFEAAELIGLQKAGVEYNYLPVRDYGDAFDYYTPVLIANTNVAAENPQMVTDFVMATARGYAYAIENPEEAADILLGAVPELDETIVREGQKYLSERYAQDAPQWGWQEADV